MSLRLSLLCLLTARPMTGYELAKQYDSSVAYLWHASHSQIYPELRRMEQDGLLRAEEARRGTVAQKRVYHITDTGRGAISDALRDVLEPSALRDADYLKASYLEFATFEDARRQYRAHAERHERDRIRFEEHALRLEARDTSLMRDRLAAYPTSMHEMIVAYKVHVYRGLARRAATETAWARDGLDLVDRLSAGPTEDAMPVGPQR